jgi:hypothetical protein
MVNKSKKKINSHLNFDKKRFLCLYALSSFINNNVITNSYITSKLIFSKT